MKHMASMALLITSGCTTMADVYHQADNDMPQGIRLISPTAQIIVNNGDGTVCFGPPADATIDLDGSASSGTFRAGASDDEIPLGGRNPNVLVTRDILFQACLAESRLGLSKNERKALFQNVLDLIRDINAQTLEGDSVTTDADSPGSGSSSSSSGFDSF